VLGQDGTVIEQGTFRSLDLQNGYVQSLLVEEQQQTTIEPDKASDISQIPKKDASPAGLKESQSEKDLLRRAGDIQLYKYYFSSIGWVHGLGLVALVVASQFCAFFPRKCLVAVQFGTQPA
jgi:hypothetical protein